jgi:hypothetical protein
MLSRWAVGVSRVLTFLLVCPTCIAQEPSTAGEKATGSTLASAPPEPIEAVFKNIRVLQGIPSTELPAIMHFMRTSLGVRCEYCHVAEEGKYRLDVKKAKQRAREMILMTRAMNQTHFDGRPVVTCNTCHRGSVKPAAVPDIGSAFANIIRREPDEPPPPLLPRVSELLERYQVATHANALPALRLTLEGWHAKVVDWGTPRARAIARGESRTGEVLIDRDKALAKSPLGDGKFIRVGSNGKRAWTLGPDGLRWVADSEFVRFQRKLNPLLPLQVRAADFSEAEVTGVAVVGGREAFVVEGKGTDGTGQKLWFAKEDGLLLRRTFYHPIALGLDPEQYDYSEYTWYGEFELPAKINTSYLDDQHLGVLKKVLRVELNVPASEAEFLPPDQ